MRDNSYRNYYDCYLRNGTEADLLPQRRGRMLDDDVIHDATFDNLDHFASELFECMICCDNPGRIGRSAATRQRLCCR